MAFATSPNIKLPISTAEEAPLSAVNVLIEPQYLIVDGDKVLEFKNAPKPAPGPSGGEPVIDAMVVRSLGLRTDPLER